MKSNSKILIGSSLTIILSSLLLGVALYFTLPDWQTRGQFGDMFGFLNSMFSGLAFIGLIYTIVLQRQELALQREELTLTRTELRRSAEAQEKSEQALNNQAESTAMAAKISAINYLLDHYNSEIKEFHGMVYIGSDPRLQRQAELQKRRSALLSQLDSVFDEILNNT
jgi:hypothetical protein